MFFIARSAATRGADFTTLLFINRLNINRKNHSPGMWANNLDMGFKLEF